MEFGRREQETLAHYRRFIANPVRLLESPDLPVGGRGLVAVMEFAPPSPEYDWVYASVGGSGILLPHAGGQPAQPQGIELLMYARARAPELAATLSALALYPSVYRTQFDVGHTVAGGDEGSVVATSPLTDFLLAQPLIESAELRIIHHADGGHTRILWAIPLYGSEREFARDHGWRALLKLFAERETDAADLWRPRVV